MLRVKWSSSKGTSEIYLVSDCYRQLLQTVAPPALWSILGIILRLQKNRFSRGGAETRSYIWILSASPRLRVRLRMLRMIGQLVHPFEAADFVLFIQAPAWAQLREDSLNHFTVNVGNSVLSPLESIGHP